MAADLEERVRARVTAMGLARTEALPIEATIVQRTLASAPESRELPPITLRGDLEIVRTLGEGGMGRVHLALQRSLDRQVAIKTLKEGADARAQSALLGEARITGALEHPGVIPVHALGADGSGSPLLVMKRVEGVDWQTLLDQPEHELWAARRGADRLEENLEILIQVCRTLEFAHARRVVHRDIKPENVMIGAFGEVYLLDWGIALPLDRAADRPGLVGTPAFMAPEMALGGAVDERTDVYLLGATLHQALTGTYRHSAATLEATLVAAALSEPVAYSASVPEALAELCNRATSADPLARPASVQAFRQELAEFLQQRNVNALCASAEERLDELSRMLAVDGVPGELSNAYQLASAARFGFAQALRELPLHQGARSGARRALLSAIELELRQEHAESARALLGELDDPEPALVQRIEAAEAAAHERKRRGEKLQALEHDMDASVSHRSRGLALAITAACMFSLVTFVLFRKGYANVTPATLLALACVISLMALTVFTFMRRVLMSNAFNRRLTALLFTAILGSLLNRALGFVHDTPPQLTVSLDSYLFMGVLASGAIFLVRGLWWAVAVTAASVVAMRSLPAYSVPIFAFAALLDVVLIYFALWVETRRARR